MNTCPVLTFEIASVNIFWDIALDMVDHNHPGDVVESEGLADRISVVIFVKLVWPVLCSAT